VAVGVDGGGGDEDFVEVGEGQGGGLRLPILRNGFTRSLVVGVSIQAAEIRSFAEIRVRQDVV
jgi:hypothetical protein